MSRPFLPREYRASDLPERLDVSQPTLNDRSLHTLFAVLINDVDRRSGIPQDLKQEILEGLTQAWMTHIERTGTDVIVESHRHGLDTSTEPLESDGRRRSPRQA